MTFVLATKGLIASDKVLATAFVGLFAGSSTYLAVAMHGPSAPTGGAARTMILVSASPEQAVVSDEDGLRRISVGAVLPGFGQISRIERRDGRWSVIFASGKVLTAGK